MDRFFPKGRKSFSPIIFVFCALTIVQVFASDKRVLLEELYDNAQLERQLQWIRSSMTLNPSEYGLPQDVVETVNRVVDVRYRPDYFRSSMIATLDEALSVGELLKLIDWYSSPLGKKILRLEMVANDPANASRMQAYVEKKLGQQLPRTSRIWLIEELMETLDAVELGTELAASASVGAQRLLQEVMPRDGMLTRAPQILKAREKPTIRKGMNDKMRSVFLYTYRALPDKEIRSYLNFAGSTAMQNFQRGQIQAMARML